LEEKIFNETGLDELFVIVMTTENGVSSFMVDGIFFTSICISDTFGG